MLPRISVEAIDPFISVKLSHTLSFVSVTMLATYSRSGRFLLDVVIMLVQSS